MIRLQVAGTDLQRVRFAASALRETVMSVRTLTAPSDNLHLHHRWRARVAGDLANLAEGDLEMLTALVRPHGYLPDFLAPSPGRRWTTFAQKIAVVAASDPQVVAAELAHLAQHRLAQQGPGRDARQRILQRLVERPDAGIAQVATALTNYRDGRRVLYARTDLGERLLAGSDAGSPHDT